MSQTWLLPALAFLALIAVLTSAGFMPAQAQVVMPDAIAFVDPATVLQAGGVNYTISLQLTIRGANYSGSNFGIYFQSDNPGILDIPRGTSVVSDTDGRASLNVITGPGYGNVTVTATMLSPDGRVRASKTYAVIGMGEVSGIVTDASGKGVPGATVTLYTLNNSTKGEQVQLAGNPATTAGGDAALPGAYSFDNVPFGSYYLEAAIDGQAAGTTLTVSHPTESAGIAVTGYVVPTPTPTPTATPTPEPSPTATPAPASPTPAPKKSIGSEDRQLIWILAAGLVLAIIIIGIQMLRQRKKK